MVDSGDHLRTVPVQPRAQRTVEHILATAAALLHEVGVDSFNTNLLAERAGLRVRTIYRYFADKHTVILCLAEQMYGRADESLTRTLAELARPEVPWRDALAEVIDDYFRTMEATPGWAAIRRAVQAVPGLDEVRTRAVTRHVAWLASALTRRGLDLPPERVGAVAATAFAAAAGVLEPAVSGGLERRRAIIAELELMLGAYFANYLD